MFYINTASDLVAFFNGYESECRAKLTICTPVKMNKKDVTTKTRANPHSTIYKLQTVVADLNINYEERVNDARMLEGQTDRTFSAEGRKWGVHINKSIIEKDEGQFYLQYIEIGKDGKSAYELEDGTKIDYADFVDFVPSHSDSSKQNLNDKVKIRTVKLENVIGINIDDKVEYLLKE